MLCVLLQREGKALPEASLPFHRALPSLTHMALVELEKAGILKFVISQVPVVVLCSLYVCTSIRYITLTFFPLAIGHIFFLSMNVKVAVWNIWNLLI